MSDIDQCTINIENETINHMHKNKQSLFVPVLKQQHLDNIGLAGNPQLLQIPSLFQQQNIPLLSHIQVSQFDYF